MMTTRALVLLTLAAARFACGSGQKRGGTHWKPQQRPQTQPEIVVGQPRSIDRDTIDDKASDHARREQNPGDDHIQEPGDEPRAEETAD
jgi:hypothetical protein